MRWNLRATGVQYMVYDHPLSLQILADMRRWITISRRATFWSIKSLC